MTAYLFDTSAISEIFRRRPNEEFLGWFRDVPPDRHHTSIVVVGELYSAAYHASHGDVWHRRIDEEILPRLHVLAFDLRCARAYGRIHADLSRRGEKIGDADIQIAATALVNTMTVVTGNRRHFERVEGLAVHSFEPGTTRQRS